jgi:hypothetical protein
MTENKTFVSARHQISIALCLASMTSSVLAQNTASPMPAEVEQAFREVVNNAASFESRSKYATLLVRAGNFEGGIAALEGTSCFPPMLPPASGSNSVYCIFA